MAMQMWLGVDNTVKAVDFKDPKFLSLLIKAPSFPLNNNDKEAACWTTATIMTNTLICGYFGTITDEKTRKGIRYYHINIRLTF